VRFVLCGKLFSTPYTTPCSYMARATFIKPATLAPFT
jgi:hypothetical protein